MIDLAWRTGLTIAFFACAMLPETAAIGSETHTIRPPAEVRELQPGTKVTEVDFSCKADGSGRCRLSQYMAYARVCGLLVLKDDRIAFELYNDDPEICRAEGGQPNGPARRYGIASVAKSITSTLVGQAIATRYGARTREQFNAVLNRPLEGLVPGLGKGPTSAYTRATLDHVLRMRSGVKWSEYGWRGILLSDANQFGLDVRDHMINSIPEFARRYTRRAVGTLPFNYSALDAAVAGYVAEAMLGHVSLVDFMEKGIWSEIGAESAARWGVDRNGTAIGACCLKATTRDLARFGNLVLDKGRVGDRQVIPRAWFELATQASWGDDTIPSTSVSQNKDCPLRYRYFWWLREGRSDYTAIGRDGQFVHIYPDQNVVIVQISDWKAWTNGDFLECETFNVHDALAIAAAAAK